MKNAACVELLRKCLAVELISFLPVFQMAWSCKKISLTSVADRMGKNEIVAEIQWITRPRNKVINVSTFTEFPFSIETIIGLNIFEYSAKSR